MTDAELKIAVYAMVDLARANCLGVDLDRDKVTLTIMVHDNIKPQLLRMMDEIEHKLKQPLAISR